MEYQIVEKSTPGRDKVKVLGATFEKGKPDREEAGQWRQKLENRADKIKYLESGERYWYGIDGFGSEKRKIPV